MKYLLTICTIVLLFFCGCERMEADFINDPDVKVFVKQIKDGSYNIRNEYGELELPNFYADHISELLEYVDDMSVVQNYPSQGISPVEGSRSLGICLLWTIEGIRTGKKFPSLSSSLLIMIGDDEARSVTEEEALEVAKLYKSWWKGEYPFNMQHDKFMVNPLENTKYYWH